MTDLRRKPKLLIAPKVLAIDFRPSAVPTAWSKTPDLIQQYISSLRTISSETLIYQVVDTLKVTSFPRLQDGRRYSNSSWLAALADDSTAFRDPHGGYMLADYNQIMEDFNLEQRVADQLIDEIWLFGGPYFGFYESRMIGKKAFWCNGPGMESPCRRFVIMGFNYQRTVREMLHDFGHRSESILSRQYGSQNYLQKLYAPLTFGPIIPPPPRNEFEKFLYNHGTVHRVPGGLEYSQDEVAWLGGLKPAWFPLVVDPNHAR